MGIESTQMPLTHPRRVQQISTW